MMTKIAIFLLKTKISICGFGYLRIGSIYAELSQIRQAVVSRAKGSVLSSLTKHFASSGVLLKPITIWVHFLQYISYRDRFCNFLLAFYDITVIRRPVQQLY